MSSRRSDAAAEPMLVAATVSTGLMAGLFYSFSIAVMRGLRRADDRTFVTSMQRINEGIQNVAFAPGFFGAMVFTTRAAMTQRRLGNKVALRWIVAALVLYLLTVGITMGINVPLNNELAKAGDADRIPDLAAVRARFEGRWVLFNVLRTLLSTAALACLSRALVVHGRADATVTV